MNNFEIIGISGRAGAGKDTAGEVLIKHGFVSLSFADNLKSICSMIFDINKDYFYDRELKEQEFDNPLVLNQDHITKLIDYAERVTNPQYTDYKDRLSQHFNTELNSPRELLQFVGTDLMRNCYSSNIWLAAFQNQCSSYKKIVVCDCRFPNERELIKSMGGTLVFIKRDHEKIKQSTHDSETSLGSESEYDVVIDNTGITRATMQADFEMWYTHLRKGDVRLNAEN